MTFEYIVLDDILSNSEQDEIEKAVTDSSHRWSFTPYTVPEHKISPDEANFAVMTSLCIKHGKVISLDSRLVMKVLSGVKKQIKLNIKSIDRAQLNFTFPQIGGSAVSPFHIDKSIDHYVVLYYINNSDGDTLLRLQNGEVINVSPKKGRALVFNGKLMHASTSPSKTPYRMAINMNVIV